MTRNIDSLFACEPGSAAADQGAPGNFNSGVFVLSILLAAAVMVSEAVVGLTPLLMSCAHNSPRAFASLVGDDDMPLLIKNGSWRFWSVNSLFEKRKQTDQRLVLVGTAVAHPGRLGGGLNDL